jgi:hypothetical protein
VTGLPGLKGDSDSSPSSTCGNITRLLKQPRPTIPAIRFAIIIVFQGDCPVTVGMGRDSRIWEPIGQPNPCLCSSHETGALPETATRLCNPLRKQSPSRHPRGTLSRTRNVSGFRNMAAAAGIGQERVSCQFDGNLLNPRRGAPGCTCQNGIAGLSASGSGPGQAPASTSAVVPVPLSAGALVCLGCPSIGAGVQWMHALVA